MPILSTTQISLYMYAIHTHVSTNKHFYHTFTSFYFINAFLHNYEEKEFDYIFLNLLYIYIYDKKYFAAKCIN